MIKPNWDLFKAKFSSNPQEYFEWFCYLLFCEEFHQNKGVSRFKNQHAIETNPIEHDNDVIGWQAKFYDTPLSQHKNELLKTLQKARDKYPDLTKLYLYTNREWSQDKDGRETNVLKDINDEAIKLNISLTWRTASFFESPFVSQECEVYAKHFFSSEKSVLNTIHNLENHTDDILSSIKTELSFNGQPITLNRENLLDQISENPERVTIISGHGGTGKTVLVKTFFEKVRGKVPFYTFKATEFELSRIDELFSGSSIVEFCKAHETNEAKYIVIDSAEKLLEINNKEPFKEFLTKVIAHDWNIIFTSRDSYIEDLNYQFFEIYKIAPINIRLNNLDDQELKEFSASNSFSLPRDNKLLELIKNPFYLDKYLDHYESSEHLNYHDFKEKLWNQIVKKSKPEREQCFIKAAIERAHSGQFFISTTCSSEIFNELTHDELLGYEATGYFITHDIYEEWALEKFIEIEFSKKTDNICFFKNIGHYLPIRRCFRNWVSEKLLVKSLYIYNFIEEVIDNNDIETYWKDEIIVSVLLSDYSETFFDIFSEDLLKNEQALLKKISFILRVACKEVDYDFFKTIGFKELNLFSLEYVLTKPKGRGWESLISFVYHNLTGIGLKNIGFILPIIHDWNSKPISGNTTKYSSLIALQYYEWLQSDRYHFSDDSEKRIMVTIIKGVFEIKDELKNILNKIIENQWKGHRDPYSELSKTILDDSDGIMASIALPKEVTELADLFWSLTPTLDDNDHYYSPVYREVEYSFGLEHSLSNIYPASAFKTPIYTLLNYHRQITVDFIISFVNKCIEHYALSRYESYVKEVTVYLDTETIQKQYISSCLWNLYRGTGSPVSPYLLQSIHMAMEKHFLEFAKKAEPDLLEKWLIYILKQSRSASITSIVTSIVLAYPDKTFNVAKILFRTKEFITHDTERLVLESGARSLYSIGQSMGARFNDIYDQERIQTCDDKHRKSSLEWLALNYQIFSSAEITEEVVEKRQSTLWEILDNYYEELPAESEQTDTDRTWRLFLARMDRRKMEITTEEKEGGIAIYFNPELNTDLKDYQANALSSQEDISKHLALKLWAEKKFKNDKTYSEYKQYEENPEKAIIEVREILEQLVAIKTDKESLSRENHESFVLFNHATPAYVCSVLLRDHFESLNPNDRIFCRGVVMDVAALALDTSYRYQISDGVQPAISVLPILLREFPEHSQEIKLLLLLNMMNDSGINAMESFSLIPCFAVNSLWSFNANAAQSLLIGYLFLRSKFEEVSRRNHHFMLTDSEQINPIEKLVEENKSAIEEIVNDRFSESKLQALNEIPLYILEKSFVLLPSEINNETQRAIAIQIVTIFAKSLTNDSRADKVDYSIKINFLRSYSNWVLGLPESDIKYFIAPFLDAFNTSESMADLFEQLVMAEDSVSSHQGFWIIWNSFKDKVFEICKNGDRGWYTSKIVKCYLFASVPWNENVTEWHSLQVQHKRFLKEVSQKIGHCPSALFSISKLLNGIGSNFLDEGVLWVSHILKRYDYLEKELERNTLYYLENLVRKYSYKNREKIKKTTEIKSNLLVILDFLVSKGSVVGYMIREDII